MYTIYKAAADFAQSNMKKVRPRCLTFFAVVNSATRINRCSVLSDYLSKDLSQH